MQFKEENYHISSDKHSTQQLIKLLPCVCNSIPTGNTVALIRERERAWIHVKGLFTSEFEQMAHTNGSVENIASHGC